MIQKKKEKKSLANWMNHLRVKKKKKKKKELFSYENDDGTFK